MSAGPAAAPHRQGVRRSPVPRGPRRISGPTRTPAAREAARAARGSRSLTAAAAGGAVALPRPRPTGAPTLLPRAVDALRRLPDHRWLDRLLRGQAWIVVIGVALMGIVAMQVSLLKMNAGIGRAVEHSATLERQNADLRQSVSALSSEERIQREAASMGLVMPPAGDVRYVRARGGEDARRGAKLMRPPNAAQAQAQTGATGAAVAEATASGVTPAAGAPAPTAATATATATPADPAAAATTTPPEQQAAPPAEPQVQQQAPAAPQAAQPQAAPTGAAAAPVATGAPGP